MYIAPMDDKWLVTKAKACYYSVYLAEGIWNIDQTCIYFNQIFLMISDDFCYDNATTNELN